MKISLLIMAIPMVSACTTPQPPPATTGPAEQHAYSTAVPRPPPELEWQRFVPHSGAFEVELPGEVKEQQSEQRSSAGVALVLQYLVDLDGSVFGVMLTAYPPGVLEDMFPQQVMSAARDATMSGMDAVILRQEKNSWDDPNDNTRSFPGRQVVAETPSGLVMKSQWYVVGDTVYQLMQTSPKELEFPGAFERVVQSFQLSSQ